MENSKLVSIIVPAYNSEQYLSTCVESVLSQSYKNIELIIVNDGSKDSTLQIAEKYASTHSFIKTISKENGGSSSARLFGVNNCSGDYIIFLDSDDYIEKDFVLNLISKTTNRNDEVVMCDFLKNGKKESENYQFLEMNSRTEIFDNFLLGGIYNRTVNKIYPKSLISESDFPVGRDMLEDAYFTSHVLEKCNHAIRIPYAGYNYIRHSGSISKSPLSKMKRAGMHSNILEKDIFLSNSISEHNKKLMVEKTYSHITNCLYSVRNIETFEIDRKLLFLISYIKETNPENKNTINFCNFMMKCKNAHDIKRQFRRFVIFKGNFRSKLSLFKAFIRLNILNK